jgi:hypothetical protein
MKTRRLVWVTLAVLAAAGAGAAAQENQPPAQTGARGAATADPGEGPRVAQELLLALDRYALNQARRMLELTDAEHEQFVPRLRALQQTRRRNLLARQRILQDLRRMTGPRAGEVDEAALRERLTALREHEDRAAAELRAAYAAVDEVLDVKRQARFRLFEENIEARKLELLMRARARAGRAGS